MAKDPAFAAHQEWLGYVQPTGLVVSIPALLEARAHLNRNFGPDHRRFLESLPTNGDGQPIPVIHDFPQFAYSVLGWTSSDLYGAPGAAPLPDSLEAPLPEYNETLRPTYALRDFQPGPGAPEWILLVQVLPDRTDFDKVLELDARNWQASPQVRFERLLRQTHIPIGLLCNRRQLRLVYAPEKELSGFLTFNLADMVQVAGRPIFAALHMLLNSERLYSVAENERLPAILANSRKYQNVVSTQLAGQMLEALYELLRGFQAADDQFKGELLRDVLARDPNHVYAGLLTTLLRLVFVLYAEDRGLLSTDAIYANHYSVTGLYDRLRADAGRYPDTMDQRYGAWAQLLALFRLIYRGGRHGVMRIPPREGYLFDPDRYLFLEGRHSRRDQPTIPRVSDGVIYRVLSKLMLLDGERLSYRTLAVEQIGSVYQATMGFSLQVATGRSIAIKAAKHNGAPATINLEQLLAVAPEKRLKWFADTTDQKLTGQIAEALKAAQSVDDLLAALDRKIAKNVTPGVVPKGAMVFQPSDERRKSGSHYTPSSLTGPIVEAALAPVLKQLGPNPRPEQILALKVCDLAMGSAAFLVEACRQLGDALIRAWHTNNEVPVLPPDEDEALYAQRLVAQRCLYGLDKNPLAADLAKLSLWLATLAKEHPFTFLDHSLRAGDALVGLTRKQIAQFNWITGKQVSFFEEELRRRIDRVSQYRERILSARDDVPYAQLAQELACADDQLSLPRMVGDAAIAAFFSAEKPKQREEKRARLQSLVAADLKNQGFITVDGEVEQAVKKLRSGSKGILPFHWELEFPEVFTTDEDGKVIGGFDVIVGNPPFAGKNTLLNAHSDFYLDWLQLIHDPAHGNADLVAHFFRRAFGLLRQDGCFGLIATKTIGQGDTRFTGLQWICTHGGTIYRARKRLKWPGEAAVIVSVLHICKGRFVGNLMLDGREVPIITAYLFHAGGHGQPVALTENEGKSYQGSILLGMGFTFDDTDEKGIANSIADMERLIAAHPANCERIFPFIGYEEVATSPTHAHHRYTINFEDFPLMRSGTGQSWFDLDDHTKKVQLQKGIVAPDYPDPVAADWPELLGIVREKVKPERDRQKRDANRERWWQYAEKRPGLYSAIRSCERVIVAGSQASTQYALAFLPREMVYSSNLSIIVAETNSAFCFVQSRVHEVWARFFMSTMKDDLAYTPTTCFEPFPFPSAWETRAGTEAAGRAYHEFRAAIMVNKQEGLTEIYNRFHDPVEDSPDIIRLRELHDSMDRAVLDVYGWTDIRPICEFIPEFNDEEDDDENGRPKKKKYRYRWPDEVRDEVLARLLELHRQRATEEGQIVTDETVAEAPAEKERPTTRTKLKKKIAEVTIASDHKQLFPEEDSAQLAKPGDDV